MPCVEYNRKLFMKNPSIKTRALFDSPEQVSQLRSELENSTEEAFKRIDRQKRECLAHAGDKVYFD